ncbi:MAG: formylglycine-generating enzyme family protein [Aetokthonos hydrillicola CCALA 1050]|nr:formylglycine-generating enzyme family protein [Aetokthonos hydrillicola CCALA 1050]MBW4590827.1 formylglycine-generating enzyme family protein [Aetokthonos hydrillicola CCALA 1050]
MDTVVRNTLLRELQVNPRFGEKRINELSNFLLVYIQQQLESDDPDLRNFAQVQEWTALAYTKPNEAAKKIASTLSHLDLNDKAEWVRLGSLVETFSEVLAEYTPLLIYVRGMGNLARGDRSGAENQLSKLNTQQEQLQVAGVNLTLPTFIKQVSRAENQLSKLNTQQEQLQDARVDLTLPTFIKQVSQPKSSPVIEKKWFQFEFVTLAQRRSGLFGLFGEKTFSEKRSQGQAEFFAEELGDGVVLEMVAIPGGQFLMGSPENEPERFSSESPQHRVTIQPFFMGKFPITQAQWAKIAVQPKVKIDLNPDPSHFKGANRPVESVSWDDAIEFCARLSNLTGKGYRLPSEAEWEYACRAGKNTAFHFGETITTYLANYNGEYTYASAPKGIYRGQTTEVGNFSPNACGLHDMHGNIWEWCEDTWHDSYEKAPVDGTAWVSDNDNNSQQRLLRGGSWVDFPRHCRSAYRYWVARVNSYDHVGFRVVVVGLAGTH